MLLDDKPYSFDRVFRIFITVSILAGVFWLMRYLSDVLIPFVAAFLLAYLLNPMVNRIQKRIRNRGFAVFISLSLGLCLLFLAACLIVPMVKHEISHMSDLFVRVVQDKDLTKRAAEYLPQGYWEKVREMVKGNEIQKIRALLDKKDLWPILQVAGKKVLPGLWSVFHGAASLALGLLGFFIVLLYLVFLLLDYQRVKDGWKSFVPPRWHDIILEFISDFDNGMNKYFRAQALVAFTVGVLFSIGFVLIGLPMAILLGLFIGLLNMVPYLQIIALVPAGLLATVQAIETGGSLWSILGLTVLVFVVVQIIQDAVLTPRIMGKVTGLSPAVILLSVSIWGKLLGFLGLIIALPMTCLLLAYYRRLVVPQGQ